MRASNETLRGSLQVILTSSLENTAFGMPGIKYFNAVSQFFMAGLVISIFLFAMGNKPRAYVFYIPISHPLRETEIPPRSTLKYKICTLALAVLMIYIIFAAVMCSIQAAKQGGAVYQLMLFSIILTYGSAYPLTTSWPVSSGSPVSVYALSSVLAFDPWHMFTSFIPYLLLSPTYINILQMYVHAYYSNTYPMANTLRSSYAFANLDDVSFASFLSLRSIR